MATSRISPLRPSIRLSPAHSRENSRSTSPDRHPESLYQKIDPLLANLSPESTLNALTSTEAVPSDESFSHDTLSQSISQVSSAERALGIRAAVAAQNLQLWYKEVQAWKWPKQIDAKQGKGFVPPVESSLGNNGSGSSDSTSLVPLGTDESVYYGCLPASMVEEYEQRIEEIRDGMDNLNVEELKEHVLSAHIPSRSRPSSSTSTMSVPPPLSYVQLSDFTAVVTATILRALPFLSRLNNLLITWDVRLLVLRQIPGLLRELKLTRSALNTSFHALRAANPSEKSESFLSPSRLRIDHVQLESAVVSVGRRMDRALDVLEGRQDSLPECWIDDLEKIESDFAAWVVEAEQYKLRIEWLRAQEQQAQKNEELESSTLSSQEKPDLSLAEPQCEPAQLETLQEDTHMETIEEEPKIEPESDSVNNIKDEPESSLAMNDSILSSTESDSSIPAVSEPDTPSSLQTQEEPKPISQVVYSVCANEGSDTPTPTQDAFPPLPLIKSPDDHPPTRVPLPATPIVENKENIPPAELKTQPALPSRESSARHSAAALAEHDIENDLSIQKAPSASIPNVLESKQVDASVDTPPNAPVNNPIYDACRQTAKTIQPDESHIADTLRLGKDVQPSQIGSVVQAPLSQPVMTAMTPVAEAPTTKTAPAMQSTQGPSAVVATDKSIPHASPVHSIKSPHSRIPVSQQMHRPLPQQCIPQEPADSMKGSFDNTSEPQKSTPQKKVPSKKPLQSPIKLSKTRPAKLNLDKNCSKPRYRRPSTGSIGSLPSNNSSLASSTDAFEPNTDSSKDGPLMTPPLSEFPQPPSYPPRGDHALRADRLRHLENRKISPRVAFQNSRSVSLPLQRFINEKFDLQMDREPVSTHAAGHPRKQPLVPAELEQQPAPLATPAVPPRGSSRRPVLTRGKSASDLKSNGETQKKVERSVRPTSKSSTLRSVYNQDQPKSLQLRQRLTAHPSLESLGVKRRELEYVEEDAAELTDPGSRASSPNKARRKPRDRLDEKVNSILSGLPGRIDLVDPHQEADTSSSSSSTDRRIRARYLSESPPGAPSRSTTPGPSLTLMPATRRRSQVFKSEDSCVRLYHLQHAGQTAPTKLFVRTVGEENQRVMVRVGGGWADLGEYLREYVIHHGRRKVSETPRVEVQGLTSRSSPGHSTPGSMLTPAPPSYMTSGRATPSRPPSVMSARPASSLNVRKVRRGSNASDAVGTRSVTTSALASFTSPPSASSSRRRLSVSSNYSFGDIQSHSPCNTSSLAPDSHSTPLGLAGPKPRARHVSMSPEGEAWVEDVLQQTRRSSSLNPPPFPLNAGPDQVPEQHDISDTVSIRSLPKVRSVGDIGTAGTSRRVVLKGLSNRR